jgi:hypothetical protein
MNPDVVQGASILYEGSRWEVQYINSKGLLDLKRADGEQLYGIDPSNVEPAPVEEKEQKQEKIALTQGSFIIYEGNTWKVQYINSTGKIDLKRSDGEQTYGVDPLEVEAAPAGAEFLYEEERLAKMSPGRLVEELSKAASGIEAKAALLSIGRLLQDENAVKDGIIQQATIIRAAKEAKAVIEPQEWPEDNWKEVNQSGTHRQTC